MIEKPYSRSRKGRRVEYVIERLYINVIGPFEEGLDRSRYWLTIVDDFTG